MGIFSPANQPHPSPKKQNNYKVGNQIERTKKSLTEKLYRQRGREKYTQQNKKKNIANKATPSLSKPCFSLFSIHPNPPQNFLSLCFLLESGGFENDYGGFVSYRLNPNDGFFTVACEDCAVLLAKFLNDVKNLAEAHF